jgi:diguanylate cyclase (GGDEF)-like protein
MDDGGGRIMNMFLGQPLTYASRATGMSVRELLDRAGDDRPVEVVMDETGWSSYQQARQVMEMTSSVLGGVRALGGIAHAYDGDMGTMADISDSLHRQGSLHALFETSTGGQNIAVSFVNTTGHRTGESEWVLENDYKPGYEPYPELCMLMGEFLQISTRFFGFFDVHVVEETCQTRGDDVCRYRVWWAEVDENEQERSLLEARINGLEQRIARFQETVSGLVLTSDLSTALNQVVRSAARAFGAPGFLLAVEAMPGHAAHVQAYGVDPDDASRLAAAIRAGEPCPELVAVVAVESSRCRYGHLAAYSPDRTMIGDPEMLQAYARLAATALDSAFALEDARREAHRAATLLELASSIASIDALDDLGRRIVEATTTVLGADRASLAVADHENGVARLVAAHGYPPELLARVVGATAPLADGGLDRIRYLSSDAFPDDDMSRILLHEGASHVVVPLIDDGAIDGWLGATVLDDPDRLELTDALEVQLRGLAAHACTAIRNARLVSAIRHQAMHDALTGLPNRALILDRAEQLLARARRDHTPISALFLDLDRFKTINDTLGHGVGDQLLQAVATRLTAAVRASDTLARLGGDEFVVLVDGARFGAGPSVAAERILEVLKQPFVLDGVDEPFTVTASIGIATSMAATSAGDLLRDADVALYEAKAAGGNQFVVFAPEMQTAVLDRVSLESDLRRAIKRDEFFLVYQPILDLRSRRITGVEALIRWQHPTRGVVDPDDFVPQLEQSGLIIPVGRWVLDEACRQLATWNRSGRHFDMSVNVTARQLATDDFVGDVSSILGITGISSESLILEITETTIMNDTDATIERLERLKTLGVRLAIDDFGTGYSSLAYLRRFPVDALKIDRTFISAIAESAEAGALIHTLVHLGKALGLSTLAEGIEDHDQFTRLQLEDCDSGQGFLFSQPLTAVALETFLAGSNNSDGNLAPFSAS